MITQKEFENTIKKFSFEDMRGNLWDRAGILLSMGYEIEAFILILATWNFARFRYVIKKFNIRKFEKTLKQINPLFKKLKNFKFEDTDFKNKEIQKHIKEIYKKLKEIAEQTGASKIMALKNPKLFVMWDTEIRKMYGIDNKATPDNYIEFLEKIKNEFGRIKWQNKKRPFAKVIDEYNCVKSGLLVETRN